MKFNILYCSFSTFKAIALITLCLSISTLNAQNSCGNNAGGPMPDVIVCPGEQAFGNSTGNNLGPNSVIQYYLHNNNLNNPIDSNQNGLFVNNGNYPLNTNLMVTAVVGPANQSGSPILDDPCTDIQATSTKVVFLDDITISSEYTCVGTDAEISYFVNGGLPAFNGSPFSISGDVVNTVLANTNNIFVSFGSSGSYTIAAEDDNGCSTTETAQYDCQIPEIVDLALTKKLAPGQSSTITAGSNITFQIEIINQGNVPLQNIRIVDYIPPGLILADPNWVMVGANAQTSFNGFLPPQGSVLVSITLNSLPTSSAITVQNAAEILYAERPNGPVIINDDDDSAFDSNNTNDGTPINDATNDVSDEDDHDIEDIIIEPLVVCAGVAGTMPTDTTFACFDEEITVTESYSILDTIRDVAFYILHDNPGNVVNNIIATSTNGTFTNPGNTDCRAFYVSYVFGPDSGDGTPNLLNECTKVLLGTPVIWLSEITIGSSTTCAVDGSNFTVNYIVNGGLPACFNATYTVGGDFTNDPINPNENIEDPLLFSNNSSYSISIKDNEGCATTNSFGPVICANTTPCSNIIEGMMPTGTIFACANSSISATEEGSVLGDLLGFYYLHDSSVDTLGTIYAKSPNGEFDDFGSYCQTFYVSYTIGPDNGNGEPNLLDECAFILPGTPVIWASPIIIETDEICNTETGMFTFNYNINGGFAECLNGQYNLNGDINTLIAEPGFNYLNNTPLPNNYTYLITATDEKTCTSTSLNGPISCEIVSPCDNVAGRMSQEPLFRCFEKSVSTEESNSQLNDNDVAYYALHEGNGNALVNIINTNTNGVFVDPGEQYNCNTLYISYVFGPNNGNDRPDLTSPCTKVLKGTPVTWSAPIEINTIEDCDEETEQYQFSYTLTGGFPSCIGNNYFLVGNDITNSMAIPDQIFTEPTLYNNGYAYTFEVTDEKGCTNSFTSQPIVCENPNPCSDSNAGNINLGILYSCANGSVTIDRLKITDNFVDAADIEGYILHDGDPTDANSIINRNVTGVFNDPERPCEILTITYVIGADDGTGFPNIEDPCTKFSNNVPVIWYSLVNISSTATCDEITGNLIVNFNISGGASACEPSTTFTISGDYQTSNITAGNYTIPEQLSSDQPYQIIATDRFDCTNIFTSEVIDCNLPDPFCGNTLGVMQFANQLRVCSDVQASAQQQNTTLADGSIGKYYLHTNNDNTLGIEIANNNSGTFDDPGLDYTCDTLYISYVLGPDNGTGEIDLESDCTFVLPGAPVVWSAPIQIFTNIVCDVETSDYKINYNLSGGFPDCFGSAKYNVAGSVNETGLSPGNYQSDAFQSNTNYELIVTDDFGCTNTYTESNAVNCYVTPYCFNQAGTAQEAQTICFNDKADGFVFDTFADLYYDIVYVLHDGVNTLGTQYGCNSNGIFNNDGTAPRYEQLYISSVVSVLDDEGKPDYDDICTEIMLPGTPVVFLDEILVATEIICDELTEKIEIKVTPVGGYPSYVMSGGYDLALNGYDTGNTIAHSLSLVYEIPAGNYELTLNDSNGCIATVGGSANCGDIVCPNQLGSQPQEAVILCGGEGIIAAVSNVNIVDSAKLIYVLHDKENIIGEILDVNTTGIFINNDDQYPLNTQLYVSAVIGMLVDGEPDFSDPCTLGNFPGTPVTFLPEITLLDDVQCQADIEQIRVVFGISGGNGPYTIKGDHIDTLEIGELAIFTLPYTTQNYALTITDENNCESLFVRATGGCNIACNDVINNAGNVLPNDRFLCSGESISIAATGNVIVADGYSHFYVLHDGSRTFLGNFIDFNTTGLFINDNENYTNKQYYISSVVTSTTAGGIPDKDDACLDASLPGTPVTFYQPITISNVEEICNENTGNYNVKFSISGGVPSNDVAEFYEVGGILTSNSIGADKVVESAPQSGERYIITAKDSNGCNTTFEKDNVVCDSPPCRQISSENIVNVISPNGDNINDSWSVPALNECYPNHRVTICNRWGDKVSEIENCPGDDCWDGSVSKNGKLLPTGAYFYIIELKGVNSTEDEIITGSITLIR